MQDGLSDNLPPWLQAAIGLGIPGTAWVIAKWSARHAVDTRIDEKLEPVHESLKKISEDVAYIRGRFDERDRQ